MSEWLKKGKDSSPEKTVRKIKAILQNAGIETEYKELDTGMEDCFSSRLTISNVKGGFFGSNGKGMGKEFCMASAYAELMERLENRMFHLRVRFDDPLMKEIFDKTQKPVYHVRGDYQPECILELKKKVAATVKPQVFGPSPEEVTDNLMEALGYNCLDFGFPMDEYYRVSTGEFVSLPTDLVCFFVNSNGMAAGNTLEEAIVQALSEIFERYCEILFINGKLTPPVIPDEYLKNFSGVWNIINRIREYEDGRFKVCVSDCSLDKSLPVVCGIVIDTKKQTFGIKFGAHPNMEVALERIFTEALQGNTLLSFAGNNKTDLKKGNINRINAWNLIKNGRGDFPPALFTGKPDYEFKPWEDVSAKTNKQMMEKMLSVLSELGSEAYILDRSYLGFPSVFIYAPGISEPVPVDDFLLKELKLTRNSIEIFSDLTALDAEGIQTLYIISKLKSPSSLENTLDVISGRPMYLADDDVVPQKYTPFLAAICLYALDRLAEAVALLKSYMQQFDDYISDDIIYCRGICMYMEGALGGMEKEELADILHAVCPKEIADRILYDLQDKEHVIERVYSYYCNGRDCDSCTNKRCQYLSLRKLYKLLYIKEYENLPERSNLSGVFGK